MSEDLYELELEEAEYKGRKVTLNSPFRLPTGSAKKFGVYVKNDKGNVVKVTFGSSSMEIKRDDPERLKSFRARMGCDTDPGPKWKANYWSCWQWRKNAKVQDDFRMATFGELLDENIQVPISVGDVVLGGRFKNKKMVVKEIGKNEKGDITINGKSLLKFRIMNQDNEDV
jgi:hypothetical protein|tara:strand:- start:650 stop:1162 length:513 start_codon:yes stop_codon:yes gene_type:complete